MLGGDVLVGEAPGLVLGTLDERARPGVEGQLATLDPGATRQQRPELDADARGVRAELAQRHGRDALGVLEQGRQDVLGVEHRALRPRGQLLGGEDGLLGLLGVAVELHGDLLWLAFGGRRGTRVGLVDVVDEGTCATRPLLVEACRQHDAGAHAQVPATAPAEVRQPLARQAEEAPVLGPRRDGQLETLAAEGLEADVAAQQRLAQRQRQVHAEVVAIAREDRVSRDVHGDIDVTAPLGLAGETDALTVPDARRGT